MKTKKNIDISFETLSLKLYLPLHHSCYRIIIIAGNGVAQRLDEPSDHHIGDCVVGILINLLVQGVIYVKYWSSLIEKQYSRLI